MKSDGVLMNTLSRALEWMPNVSCITYSPYPRHLPVEAKDMRDLLPRGITPSLATGFTAADHPFRQLIAALYVSQYAGIREFRTETRNNNNPGTEFALSIFDLKDDNEMAAGRYLFHQLEKLVLNMAIWGLDDDVLHRALDKFAELIRTTTNLQHLHFHPTHWQSEIEARSLFARLGLDTMWPRLQTLSLRKILGDEAQFSDLIKRHKRTLTSVELSRCEILNGTWADVVDEVVYGTDISSFVLDRVNERTLPHIDFASLSKWERERWEYEGLVEVTKDGERSFVSAVLYATIQT